MNEVALQRIRRARREATANLERDRDYQGCRATLDRLDAEEAEVRATAEAPVTRREVAAALADKERLFQSAQPRTQQRIAQALFKKVEVLRPTQVWVHAGEVAEAPGWATAMQGEFTAVVRTYGRGERI